MEPVLSPWRFCLTLFIGMLVMIELGRRVGLHRRRRDPDDDHGNFSTMEGAMFALFGLMIAFTFSGAATRLNEKRLMIAEEANTIEVAWLRLQLLPEDSRPPLKQLFRDYADSRLETYRRLPDVTAAEAEMAHSRKIQEDLWSAATVASTLPGAHPDAGKLLLPALNAMFDIRTIRTMELENHPPTVIYMLLFGLALISSLLAGSRMSGSSHRSWLHILAFIVITVSVVFVVLDIEYPRWGVITLDQADRFIRAVREGMH